MASETLVTGGKIDRLPQGVLTILATKVLDFVCLNVWNNYLKEKHVRRFSFFWQLTKVTQYHIKVVLNSFSTQQNPTCNLVIIVSSDYNINYKLKLTMQCYKKLNRVAPLITDSPLTSSSTFPLFYNKKIFIYIFYKSRFSIYK